MEPVTAALTAFGSAAGTLISGIAQADRASREAGIAEANADIAKDQARRNAEAIRERALRLQGQQRAAAGASGIALDGSSFVDAIDDSAIQSELDALTARYEGQLQARSDRLQAAASQSAEEGDLFQAVFGAGSDALSGYGRWQRLRRGEN